MWMGTKLSLMQNSGKGGLGWQTPKPTSESSTQIRGAETPSKTSSKHELSEALKHTKMGGRNGKTKL